MRASIGGMDLVGAGLLVITFLLNWRDWRSDWAKNRRWTVSALTRRRAVVLILCLLLHWGIVALAIFIEPARNRPVWGAFWLVPLMLGLQICLLGRSELYQPREGPLCGPQSQDRR